MKRVLLVVLVAVLLCGILAACSADLSGIWECDDGTTFEFKENNVLIKNNTDGSVSELGYKISGSTLQIGSIYNDGTFKPIGGDWEVKGDTIVIKGGEFIFAVKQ